MIEMIECIQGRKIETRESECDRALPLPLEAEGRYCATLRKRRCERAMVEVRQDGYDDALDDKKGGDGADEGIAVRCALVGCMELYCRSCAI